MADQGKERKQHTSIVQREESRLRVEVKMHVLEAWAKDGIPWMRREDGSYDRNSDGKRMLEYYPKSTEQVKQWRKNQNGAGLVEILAKLVEDNKLTSDHLRYFPADYSEPSYGNNALKAYGKSGAYLAMVQEYAERIEGAVARLRRKAEEQLAGEDNRGLVAQMQQRLKDMDAQRQSAVDLYQEALDRVDQAETSRKKAEKNHRNAKQAFDAELAQKDSVIRSQAERIAEQDKVISERDEIIASLQAELETFKTMAVATAKPVNSKDVISNTTDNKVVTLFGDGTGIPSKEVDDAAS